VIVDGFEQVEAVFRERAALQTEGGLAFAATLEGRPIVDLVAGEQAPGRPWTSDTRTGVASVTKGWAVMCVQILFDRGDLTLDMPVVDVWPEFGANGKDRITLRDILHHTAGVIGVPDVATLVQWDGGGWDDLDAIAERLAAAKPAWEPGTRCGYHAVTFGWLVGEIVRRVCGRTLGTLFHEEIAAPLGVRSAIGVPRAEQGDIAKSIPNDTLMEVPALLRPLVKNLPEKLRNPNTLPGQAFLGDGTRSIMDAIGDLMADGRFQEAEVPASNGVTSARDLARLYAPLANGGELEGRRYFSEKSMQVFLEPAPPHIDEVMGDITNLPILRQLIRRMAVVNRTAGGYDRNRPRGKKQPLGPNPRTIGNGGAGGHVVFADPDAHLTGAFVRSAMSPNNETQEALIATLFSCLQKIS
jgi:CubicO group peptidase (beta-lactamase class C family)